MRNFYFGILMITDSKLEKVSFSRKFKRAYQRTLLLIIGFFSPVRIKVNPWSSPKSILIFMQEKLGDAILTTPLLSILKKNFPEIEIHLVIFHKASNIFNDDPNVYQVHNFKKDKIGTARKLKKMKFDILFNTKDHPSFTFIALGRYLNARYKVGIDHYFHKNHYHHLASVDFLAHTIKKNCSILPIFNINPSEIELKPYVPPKKISQQAMQYAEQMPERKLIGINLSAGSKEKEWEVDEWRKFIEEVNEDFVVFAVGDQLGNKKILESEYECVIDSPDTQSINEAAAFVKKLKLLVTPSTGLLHVASCYDIGVVGLYRKDPSDHMRFAPFGVPFKKIIAKDHIVAKVTVSVVVEATQELLSELK